MKKNAYRKMLEIRLFEERVARLYADAKIPGFVHLCTGQEATAVGSCLALEEKDYIITNHRGHGHHIARGAHFNRMMAELMGKRDGYCRGRGGCLHLTPAEVGSLGANGIVAAGTIIAPGAALSSVLQGTGQVVICFFGDGATNQGMFHEAVNLAAVWKLPVIFLCENNMYAEATPIYQSMAIKNVSQRATAYGITGVTVDGNDVQEVYRATADAVARARSGQGATLLECMTYRWGGHYEGDPETYRSREEVLEWQLRCPVNRLKNELLTEGLLSEDEDAALREKINEDLDGAEKFAEDSPLPESDDLMKDIFAPAAPAQEVEPSNNVGSARPITGLMAIQEALREEMLRDANVFMLGEDMEQAVFGVSTELFTEFGPNRVRNTPISENAIVGCAIGAAMAGMRPVVEIMFQDFLFTCMDAIVNQAAKIRYMTGGSFKVPMVIRSPGGCGFAAAAQHSQSLASIFISVPGLKVVCPSTAADAKGLLKAAIRDDNPVMFLESKSLYFDGDDVPEGDYVIPLGMADVKREGADVTVVAVSVMVPKVIMLAQELSAEGIEIEVVDPRTLVPLDKETIFASVKKTGRLVIVEECTFTGGIGAEIAALAASDVFDYLDAPIVRVAAPDVPIPFSPELEDLVVPSDEDIKKAIMRVL